ncbi:hypothetical protein FH972_021368 [Carpinus fangiana]|uniref:Uncharacterized protein n=1 Tax=Carpinus fangiana TaxID=176857 RepID=A0A5N6KPD2_9ROSI|nr:hypothetical protein FH972_021368 [Carpinus fangiana]
MHRLQLAPRFLQNVACSPLRCYHAQRSQLPLPYLDQEHHQLDAKNPRHLLRHLLRECTYLADPVARAWLKAHILHRFSKYTTAATSSNALLQTRIPAKLREGKKALSYLRRANSGYLNEVERVLSYGYGRVGRRRRELLQPLKQSVLTNDMVGNATSEGTSSGDIVSRILAKHPTVLPAAAAAAVPHLAPPLEKLYLEQQRRNRLLDKSVKLGKVVGPDIPALNAWQRPLPAKRVKNQVKRWYADIMSKLLPPLPVREWNVLEGLATGKIPWSPVPCSRRREMAGCVPAGTLDQLLQLELGILAKQTPSSRGGRKQPHRITGRFMRRRWLDLLAQTPKLELDQHSGQHTVYWSQKARFQRRGNLTTSLKAALGMDPLTATITIAGGIQTVFTFATALKNFIDDAKSAREDLKSLAGIIEATFLSIQELQTLLKQNEHTKAWNDYGIIRAKKCIEDGFFIVGKLGHLLLKSGCKLDEDVAQNLDSRVVSTLLWPYYKPQLRELKTELILLKLDVSTAHTTYRAPSWTAEEETKGKETLLKYQASRKQFMRQLQALKKERIERAKNPPGTYRSISSDSIAASSDRSTGYLSSVHSPRRKAHLADEERRVFEEWEEAVVQRIRLESRLKEEEVAAAKQKEQAIRDAFVEQIKKDAADRQAELHLKREQMEAMIKDRDIPPKDKKQIIETAIQTFHPIMQDDVLVRALLNQTDPQQATAAEPTPILDLKVKASQQSLTRRPWSFSRTRRPGSDNWSGANHSTPSLLRDQTAPGGLAVLYAAHFTPDPYGAFRSIEVEARSLWAKCSEKVTKQSEELTAEFMFLPENCKSAILNLLETLCIASKDYTWNMLLVYQARARSRRNFFTSRKHALSEQGSAGVFVIFKRHLRQHHGISSSGILQKITNADATTNFLGQGQGTEHEGQGEDSNERLKSREDVQGLGTQPAAVHANTDFFHQNQSQRETYQQNQTPDTSGQVYQIQLTEDEQKPKYRVGLKGKNLLEFFYAPPEFKWNIDPNDSQRVLINADIPHTEVVSLLKSMHGRQFRGDISEPRFDVDLGNAVLQSKAALAQQEKKINNLSKRAMGESRYQAKPFIEDDYADYVYPLPQERDRRRPEEEFDDEDRGRSRYTTRRGRPEPQNRRERDISPVLHSNYIPQPPGHYSFSPKSYPAPTNYGFNTYGYLVPTPDNYNRPQEPLEEHIRFKDAVGRKFRFPWAQCRTWQGMETLITQAFIHVDVLGKEVKDGHYDLLGPGGDIILPEVWNAVVQPGWSITMHMWPFSELKKPGTNDSKPSWPSTSAQSPPPPPKVRVSFSPPPPPPAKWFPPPPPTNAEYGSFDPYAMPDIPMSKTYDTYEVRPAQREAVHSIQSRGRHAHVSFNEVERYKFAPPPVSPPRERERRRSRSRSFSRERRQRVSSVFVESHIPTTRAANGLDIVDAEPNLSDEDEDEAIGLEAADLVVNQWTSNTIRASADESQIKPPEQPAEQPRESNPPTSTDPPQPDP